MKGLNKLYYLKLEIENLKEEIKGLAEISSTELTGMPHGTGVSNPTEQYFLKKEKLLQRLNYKLEKYIDERETIENRIENIDDAEVRMIARYRFIDNLIWEDIGKKMYSDRSACYRKLKKYFEGKKENE
jgi:hypothetical protein